MNPSVNTGPVRGLSDGDDRLVEADEPLLALQQACGGELNTTIAIPELLATVAKARTLGLKMSRPIFAFDGRHRMTGWAEVGPRLDDSETFEIVITDWRRVAAKEQDDDETADLVREIDRSFAECAMRVDEEQRVLSVEAEAPDLRSFASRLEKADRPVWTEYLDFVDIPDPLNDWRAFDNARCRIDGSMRFWTAHLEQLGRESDEPSGFVVYLTADSPLEQSEGDTRGDAAYSPSLGRDLGPVLRQPIDRIITNAETIRAKLAGPLNDQYSTYAQDIANAGQHLLGLMDDLSDLEIVESEAFATAPDRIDLADVARRACGILGVKAQEKRIVLRPPMEGESQMAIAEFRRVLQILLNLVGNAIRYSPEDSQVWIRLDGVGDRAMVTVADLGHGLDEEQQDRVFEKFERLGRSGDGGSGLGLYISRRIARAMDGDLTVESAPGQGARFTLTVPAAT